MKKSKAIFGVFVGFFIGIINGMLGTGGGTVAVPYLEKKGFEPKKAHATAISIILPISVISAFFYAKSGAVELTPTLTLCLSGIAGGVVGAKLLGKIPRRWLLISFGISMLYMAVRMVIK